MPPPEMESNTTRPAEDTTRTGKECDAETLSKVEEVSGNYLAELMATISNLRQKLQDEKLVNAELQNIKAGLQGKIAVHSERFNQLGIENLQAMMIEVKTELSSAKMESEQLSSELLIQNKKMLADILKNTSRFEDMRLHFQDKQDQSVGDDIAKCKDLSNRVKEIDNNIEQFQECKEHVLSTLQGLGGTEDLMDYFLDELNTSDAHISLLNSKLGAMKPNLSG